MIDDTSPLLEIDTLEVRYRSGAQDVFAVTEFDLSLAQGESMALIGESGCGKSTVAMAIMRYLGESGRIAKGQINLKGRNLAELSASELRSLRNNGVSMVYQDAAGALDPTMKVGRQLIEVLDGRPELSAEECLARVLEMLQSVGMPDPTDTMRRYPHQLSGGQQQRVVIAMAFLAEPDLLILDEPTTALDVTVEAEVIHLLARMRKEHGTAMLFISHNLALVGRVCERIAVMYAGQVVEIGTTDVILRDPQHPYTQGLVECIPRLDKGHAEYHLNSIPGQVPQLLEVPQTCTFMDRCRHARSGICDDSIAFESARDGVLVRCKRWNALQTDIGSDMEGGEITDHAPPGDPAQVLDVEDLSKTYVLNDPFSRKTRRVHAGNHISFDLNAGETLGIVGESGCGKSTLARIIIGLETSSSGKVRLLGADVTGKHTEQRNDEQIRNAQMVFQNPDSTLNPTHTVGFILDRAVKLLGDIRGKSARRHEVENLLSLVRLPQELSGTRAGRLSGGQKQRVAVARAFAGRPSLVVADEPTSALDTSVKTAILQLLLSVQKETGTSLIFISHDLAVVRYIADRVCVMYLGHVVEMGRVNDVFEPPYHPYTRALLAAIPTIEGDALPSDQSLVGEVTTWTSQSRGCPYAQRCEQRINGLCDVEAPPRRKFGKHHIIQCHLSEAELRAAPSVLAKCAEDA